MKTEFERISEIMYTLLEHQPVIDVPYEKINDIAKDNTDFFFLTDKIIFRTNYEKKNTEQVAVISGYSLL